MARRPNKLETVELRVSTNPRVEQLLIRLVETGLYGKNPAEAVERLVTRSLEGLLTDGFFEKVSTNQPAGAASGPQDGKRRE